MDANLISETNWVEYFDEESEQPYFYDRNTKETQYEEPEDYAIWLNSEIDKYLKSSTTWRRQKDEKRGKYFYFNKSTNKSQWEIPSEQVDFESFVKQVNIDRMQADSPYDDREDEQLSVSEGYRSPADLYDEDFESKLCDDEASAVYNDVVAEDDELSPSDLKRNFSSSAYKSESGMQDIATGGNDDESVQYAVADSDAVTNAQARQREYEAVKEKLSARDAIMEPTIKKTVERYLTLDHNSTTVVQCLEHGYSGYAQMTHIVCLWLEKACAGGINGSGDGGGGVSDYFDAEEFVAEEIAATIKRKFNKVIADRIVDERSDAPGWLAGMMHEPRWRRLLLELFDESGNKGSALLGYCIKYLSSQGFHKEIAHVIRESDYFSVYNDLLKDCIGRFGEALCSSALDTSGESRESTSTPPPDMTTIVGATKDNPQGVDSSSSTRSNESLEGIVADLKRMCCSSEYMFLYAQAVLSALEQACLTSEESSGIITSGSAANDSVINTKKRGREVTEDLPILPSTGALTCQWAGKIKRLRQELDESVLWGAERGASLDQEVAQWVPRSLNQSESFSLLLTDLVCASKEVSQRQSRCAEGRDDADEHPSFPAFAAPVSDVSGPGGRGLLAVSLKVLQAGEISDGQIKDMCSIWFGVSRSVSDDFFQVDPGEVQGIFRNPSSSIVHDFQNMLHPQLIRILVCSLVHPVRCKRLQYSKRRLTHLLALSAVAYEYLCFQRQGTPTWTEHAVSARVAAIVDGLIQTSRICAEMTTMVSTTEKLTSVIDLMKEPIVSMTSLYWIRAVVADPVFLSKSLQCQVYAVMLQMVVFAATRFPLQRLDCHEILQAFFKSASAMVSSEAAESRETSGVKSDVLGVMIHLIGTGFVSRPLSFLAEHISDTSSSKFDMALIRHVVVKLLTTIAPPFSKPFASRIVDLFLQKSSRKAMESQHFSREGVLALHKFRGAISSDIIDANRLKEFDKLVTSSGKGSSTIYSKF